MKITLLTALTIFTSTAFACPDLSGTYQCDNNSKLEISQKMVGDFTLFDIADINLDTGLENDYVQELANNVFRTFPIRQTPENTPGITYSGKTKGQCTANEFNVHNFVYLHMAQNTNQIYAGVRSYTQLEDGSIQYKYVLNNKIKILTNCK